MKLQPLMLKGFKLSPSKIKGIEWALAEASKWNCKDSELLRFVLKLAELLAPATIPRGGYLVLQVYAGEPMGLLKEACDGSAVWPTSDHLYLCLYMYQTHHIESTAQFGPGAQDKKETIWIEKTS